MLRPVRDDSNSSLNAAPHERPASNQPSFRVSNRGTHYGDQRALAGTGDHGGLERSVTALAKL